ncbi:hypothetical protein [Carboxylicivirga taeanensis]|uniref:hypothetical protein n=1 Tax=Carboxylicivirga taeanensis TaxID=1416875 RepID=UPI003F6E08EC
MKFNPIIFALILILLGCKSANTLTALSELTVENHNRNELIVNRKPDYGYGHRDGSVILQEISMDIHKLNESCVIGKVFDSKSEEPLHNALISIVTIQSGLTSIQKYKTDSEGTFKAELKGTIEKIQVEFIAFRTLKIDFNK